MQDMRCIIILMGYFEWIFGKPKIKYQKTEKIPTHEILISIDLEDHKQYN